MLQPTDGTTPPQVLLEREVWPSSWTPDGRHLAAVEGGDIVIVSLGGGKVSARRLFETPHSEFWPEFSPDGRWLAYGPNVSGRFEVFVRPYPGPGAAEQVSLEGGWNPAWHPNDRELCFVTFPDPARRRCSMMTVDIATTPALRVARPKTLFEFDWTTIGFNRTPIRCYEVSPDGQRFFATRPLPAAPLAPVTQVNVILNWLEELKAKVPAR